MFTTDPRNESFVSALGTTGKRHWRLFSLSLHVPWFVLTTKDSTSEARQSRTVCIAWDTDLVNVLEFLRGEEVTGLLCMVPGTGSAEGRWMAREVREVWQLQLHAGTAVVFRDEQGQEFGDRSNDCLPQEKGPRRLILKLDAGPASGGIGASTSNLNRTDP